jgi:hypothetical protein
MNGWKVVRTVGTEEEASLVAGFLQSRGVAANIESLLFHQEPVNFGRLGEVRVLVNGADEERARAVLEELPAGGAELPEDAEPPAGDGEETPE